MSKAAQGISGDPFSKPTQHVDTLGRTLDDIQAGLLFLLSHQYVPFYSILVKRLENLHMCGEEAASRAFDVQKS